MVSSTDFRIFMYQVLRIAILDTTISQYIKELRKQECILVGCVPSAVVAVWGGSSRGVSARGMSAWGLSARGCLPRGCLPRGIVCLGICSGRGWLPRGVSAQGV